MLPSSYICTECREKFHYKFQEACYYIGSAPLGVSVADQHLMPIPVRAAWCKDCNGLCVAEDIASLRTFENAYGAARRGQRVEYPIETGSFEAERAMSMVEPYLRWRMARRHAARVLCCGGTSFQYMDVEQPLLKHAECEYGFVKPGYWIGGYCGPGPGVRSPANIAVFDQEGERIGLMTWVRRSETGSHWEVEFSTYEHTCE